MKLELVAFAALSVSLVGCQGNVSGSTPSTIGAAAGATSSAGAGPGSGGGGTGPTVMSTGMGLPPATGRRLTGSEYVRSVSDLFGQDFSANLTLLPEDAAPNGFRNDRAALLPSASRTFAIEEVAWAVADNVNAATLSKLGTCTDLTDICEKSFVSTLGRLVFRRPLTDLEVPRYVGLFAAAQSEGEGFEAGARMVVAGLLQSPYFQYRLERADTPVDGAGHRVVNDYELASRLSYLLWGSTPGPALLDQAAQGLLTKQDSAAIVDQMLQSPQAHAGLSAFVDDWLSLYHLERLSRDVAVFPEYTPALAPLMKQEVNGLFDRIGFTASADLRQVFSDTKSTFDAKLGPLYGLTAAQVQALPNSGGLMDLASVPTRGGLLAMPGLITAQSSKNEGSIVQRGLFVLRALMCRNVPPPPKNVATNLDAVPTTLTQRDRFALHTKDAICGGCHLQFDPLGQAFEPYDGLGRRHEIDANGNVVRGDGDFTLDGAMHSYKDMREFQTILAGSESVRSCVSQRFLQYAYGRQIAPEEQVLVDATAVSFQSASNSYLGLARSVATDPLFRQMLETPEGQMQ